MTANEERLPRLLALIPWLRAHPGVEVATAARQFAITEAALRADIELLLFCGLPGLGPSDLIDVEFEGGTVTVLDAQTLDRPLRLTGDEGQSLLAAARALLEVPGLLDPEPVESVIIKLRGAVLAGRSPEERLSVELATGSEDPAVLSAARDALASGRRLRLRYLVERRDEITERSVDPLELRLVEGRVYLHAWDPERAGTRHFRLDRALAATVLDEAAAAPSGVGSPSYPAAVFASRGDDVAVRLELSARARWVSDSYAVEAVEELPAGRVRILLRTPEAGWLARLVLALGGEAVVLDPPEVADSVRATARAGLAAYGAL